MQYQQAYFTRSFRKIVLTQDVEGLGVRGESVFVKPGYAFNMLVPSKKAVFATDPIAKSITTDVSPSMSSHHPYSACGIEKKTRRKNVGGIP